jgi:asparagine synthase (glutamine-hydrolysing)
MTDAIAHRGPDGSGAYVGNGIALGHRRLAIIDLAGGAQPRVDEASGAALVFNGEIYGYKRLAAELAEQGIHLRDYSDTEVLFQMLLLRGPRATLEHIDGMFAFAFWDGRGTLTLARDRFGEKPLFYGTAFKGLVFASELSALCKHPSFRGRGIDREAAYQFLTYEYLPGHRSGREGISKLPAGHLLTYSAETVLVERYWQLKVGATERLAGEGEALERLDHLLDRAVADRLVADVPVGVFLSGGVDSGLITAMAARHSSDITAFTVKMPERSFDETPHAAAVARHLGVRHEVIELGNTDVVSAFETLSATSHELLADSSLLPTYLVCREARRHAKVVLGGDGADEIFAGYPNFQAQLASPVMGQIPAAVGELARRCLALLPPSRSYMSLSFRLRQLTQGFGAHPDVQTFLWMAPFSEEETRAIWRADALPPQDVCFEPIREWEKLSPPEGRLERLLHLFASTYLPEDILTKTDRASMLNGLEVRAPFLAREFAEFASSLPNEWKLKGLQTKYLLKKLAARFVPPSTVYRRKHGFALPLAELLRSVFFEPVSARLLDRRNPVYDWFNSPALERLLVEHRSGKRDHAKKLWSLYTLFCVASRAY